MPLNLIRRATKGAPLTTADYDGNLDKIENAVVAVEAVQVEGRVTQNEEDIVSLDGRVGDNETDITSLENRVTPVEAHVGTTTGNPHATTKSEVGLGDVTNDAQLKRSAGDIDTFTEKSNPVDNDIVLLEDSANSFAKRKAKVSKLKGVNLEFRSTDPDNPPSGESVLWISDGTASGSAGDVLMKITVGSTTKTFVLVQFNTGLDYA